MKILKTEQMVQTDPNGNFIQDALTGNTSVPGDVYTPGAISVFARVAPSGTNTPAYYPGHRDIAILSNTINGCSLDGINVVSAGSGIRVDGNHLTNVNRVFAPGAGSWYNLVSGQPITVQRSMGAKMQSNTMEKVAVNWTSNAPTYRVLASYTNATANNVGWFYTNSVASNGLRNLGQSFYATSNGIIDSFSLQAAGQVQVAASTAAFTVKLFESTNSAAIGTNILTQDGTYLHNRLNSITGGWVTFDIQDSPLVAGRYYTFMLAWDAPALTRTQGFNNKNPDGYPNGRRWWSTDGISYSDDQYNDLFFSVQGTTQ